MKGSIKSIVSFVLFLAAPAAMAAAVYFSEVPTNWRLENYPHVSDVGAWFTPSSCPHGRIGLPITAKESDKNRFWALVTAAKLTQKSMFIIYDNATAPHCTILSFGM